MKHSCICLLSGGRRGTGTSGGGAGKGADMGDSWSYIPQEIPRKAENKTKVLEIHAITCQAIIY